jgi:hypothetical protein
MGSCRSLKDDDVLNFKLLEHSPSLITLRKYSTDLAELYKKKLKIAVIPLEISLNASMPSLSKPQSFSYWGEVFCDTLICTGNICTTHDPCTEMAEHEQTHPICYLSFVSKFKLSGSMLN